MLSARAILRLLIEDDELAPQPPPEDPGQVNPQPDSDLPADPRQEIDRLLAQKPYAIPGTGPTQLFNRLTEWLARQRHRNPNRLRLRGAATYIIRYADEDGRIAVRYHDTDVITAFPDGTVVVDSGGWRPGGEHANMGWTMPAGTTTMARINEWLDAGWQIYRLPILRNRDQKGEGGTWFWYNRGHSGRWAYTDGDKILPNGSLLPQRYPEPDEFVPVKRRRL